MGGFPQQVLVFIFEKRRELKLVVFMEGCKTKYEVF